MQKINDSFDKVINLSKKKLPTSQERKEMVDILSDLSTEEKQALSKKVNDHYLSTTNTEEKVNLSGMGLYIRWMAAKPEEKKMEKELQTTKRVNILRTGVCKIDYTTNKRIFQIVIYHEEDGYRIRINEKIGNERKKIRDKEQTLPYKKESVIKDNVQELLINMGKILDYHAGADRKKIPEEVKKAYVMLKWSISKKIDIVKKITPNIQYQKEYLEGRFREEKWYKEEIEAEYKKQKPMKKETKIVVSFPVNKYEDIEQTLLSYTTQQAGLNKNEYEMVILINRPNKETPFDKETKEKIERFVQQHPEYNITVFNHTFDFAKWEKVNMGEIYKLLGDMILYRNIQRLKEYPDMNQKKIDQLIMRMWWADSTKKNPEFLKMITEEFDKNTKLARLTTESRMDPELAQAFPLLQIDATLESAYNRFWAKGKANSTVGNGTFKAHLYAEINGHRNVKVSEDTDMVRRMISKIREKWYQKKHILKKNAIDNSADRAIYGMLQWRTYFDRYSNQWFSDQDKTKNINREKRAIQNKGKDQRLGRLELTKDNLEKEIGGFYRAKFLDMQWKSAIYREFIKKYKEKNGKEPSTIEKSQKIREIIDNLFSRSLARWLGIPPKMYQINHGDIEVGQDNRIYAKPNNKIIIDNNVTKLLQKKSEEKINNGGFNYR